MVSQACYTTSDRRYSSRHYPFGPSSLSSSSANSSIYFHEHQRRLHHDPPPPPPPPTLPSTRALTSAGTMPHGGHEGGHHHLETEAAPQRKRIAVACGRCRKRKIRCSGDPGQGQPCTNCKNAGAEPCQFLRVSSREAHIRPDAAPAPPDFGYPLSDARVYASRTPIPGGPPPPPHTSLYGGPPGSDLPGTLTSPHGTVDMLSYRTAAAAAAAYGAYAAHPHAGKTYYPAMHAYGTPYAGAEEFEFGLAPAGVAAAAGQSVLGTTEATTAMGWNSRAKVTGFTAASSGVYLDSATPAVDGGYTTYAGAGGISSREGSNFSFSGVAASLPAGMSVPTTTERLLPNPTGRSASVLPYPASVKPPSAAQSASSSTAGATLADVATAAATYASSFETSGLSYSGSSQAPASTRTGSDTSYPPPPPATGAEGMFNEDSRSSQSQSSGGFEMGTYTTEPRRESDTAGGSSHAGSSYQSDGSHGHDSASSSEHHSLSSTSTSYLNDGASSSLSLSSSSESRIATAVATRH